MTKSGRKENASGQGKKRSENIKVRRNPKHHGQPFWFKPVGNRPKDRDLLRELGLKVSF